MATVTVRGGAKDVKQVGTVQITGYDAGTTYTITVGAGNNTHAISQVGDTNADTTAAALQVLCSASLHPYFTAIVFTVATDTITLTAGTAGCAFTAASSVAGAAGTIGAYSATTANTGTNDLNNVDNYDGAAVVASSDTFNFGVGCPPMTTGLDQSAKTGVTLNHPRGAGNVGLNPAAFATSADGATVDTTVPEYRTTYLAIDCTTITIGQQYGPSQPTAATAIRIDNTIAGAANIYVKGVAGTSTATGIPTLNLKTGGTSTVVTITSCVGGVGLGVDSISQTMSVGAVYLNDPTGASKLYVGPGVSWTGIVVDGSTAIIDRATAGTPTLAVHGGSVTTTGTTMQLTTATQTGGTVIANHNPATGFCTTWNHTGGILDGTRSQNNRTITTYNPEPGATLKRNAALIITNWGDATGPHTIAWT